MAPSILQVSGEQIVDGDGNPVLLRGCAVGGWMNMENFITGYPGQEKQHRASLLKVLGKDNYDYFFDRFLHHFFTEKDAKFLKSVGMNCLRIPFNYRHFEDDMEPRKLNEQGFEYLNRVIGACASEGIYTILDLHAVPGGQNPDWHSDNPTGEALFWEYRDFQDRVVWLWEKIAERYKENPWVAGYNPLNEPADPQHQRLVEFYKRIHKAIRAIDPHHILFLDGNTFAAEFRGFNELLPLDNCVFALHDYSNLGFPRGAPGYFGTDEQKKQLETQYLRKAKFMMDNKVPVWNGEFGPVYEENDEEVNQRRYNLLGEQLRIYDKYKIAWSIWVYKDIGMQGMVYASPDSKWRKTLAKWLERKKLMQTDAWGVTPNPRIDNIFEQLKEWIEWDGTVPSDDPAHPDHDPSKVEERRKEIERDRVNPDAGKKYPTTWNTERHLSRLVKQCFLADTLHDQFAEHFRGMGEKELDEMARSFAFEECKQREGLNAILREHSGL